MLCRTLSQAVAVGLKFRREGPLCRYVGFTKPRASPTWNEVFSLPGQYAGSSAHGGQRSGLRLGLHQGSLGGYQPGVGSNLRWGYCLSWGLCPCCSGPWEEGYAHMDITVQTHHPAPRSPYLPLQAW